MRDSFSQNFPKYWEVFSPISANISPIKYPVSNGNGVPAIVSVMCESLDLEMILLRVAAVARLVAAVMEGVNASA